MPPRRPSSCTTNREFCETVVVEPTEEHPDAARPNEPSTLGTVVSLGSSIVGSIVVGLLLGLYLDHEAGTSPLFLLLGLFLGIAAAGFALKAAATRLGGGSK